MSKAHAVLSASGSHRWLACPPSARLEQKFPAKTSSYAEEGTLAHKVAELKARYLFNTLEREIYDDALAACRKNKYYTEEMYECAALYADFITERYTDACQTCADPLVAFETRLDFSKYVPGGFGTGDCLIIAEPVLEVIDFKYGKGVRVDAENNPQMQLYALGALEEYGALYDIETVRMTIFQPRLFGTFDTAEISVKELAAWAENVVKPRAELAEQGKGDFAPSEEVCRFCRAKEQCRARAEQNLALFDDSPDPELISIDEAAQILLKADDIEAWLKDLKSLVSSTIIHGTPVAGWKMVEGRSVRRFADEDKVVAAMRGAGIADAMLFERKLITLTQMEKDFGKKRIGEILGDLIVKPKGAPTLAPESDKRPAYRFEEEIIKAFDE